MHDLAHKCAELNKMMEGFSKEERAMILEDSIKTQNMVGLTEAQNELVAQIEVGNTKAVIELLRTKMDVNYIYVADTPLTIAVANGRHQIVELLLSHRANVNPHSTNGASPLGIASFMNQNSKIGQMLLSHGAKMERIAGLEGNVELHYAAMGGRVHMIRLLLSQNAFIDQRYNDGTTPLSLACQNGHLNATRLLLFYGANIDLPDHSGATPFFHAAAKGHYDVAHLLLSQGTNFELQLLNESNQEFSKVFTNYKRTIAKKNIRWTPLKIAESAAKHGTHPKGSLRINYLIRLEKLHTFPLIKSSSLNHVGMMGTAGTKREGGICLESPIGTALYLCSNILRRAMEYVVEPDLHIDDDAVDERGYNLVRDVDGQVTGVRVDIFEPRKGFTRSKSRNSEPALCEPIREDELAKRREKEIKLELGNQWLKTLKYQTEIFLGFEAKIGCDGWANNIEPTDEGVDPSPISELYFRINGLIFMWLEEQFWWMLINEIVEVEIISNPDGSNSKCNSSHSKGTAVFSENACSNLRCVHPKASKVALKLCGKCEKVRYCKRECQLTDWPVHKLACKKFSRK